MNNNVGKGKRGLAERNHMIFDKKSLNFGVANGGVSQQPPQGPVICWDRFLPVRSIKVLLVEDDDSTRHVVRALFCNCSYEVTAVSNGLQAWKVLENPENCIGLVLTEVAMPILSGIGLLCKIMNHKTLKNIPVIMMSSHDSMGIIFKCLSKGAVDFLVKPIRRNELKNLWQHVWRRCHSSSGSGSESATNFRKSTKSRSNDASENNSDSNEENDYGSKGLSIRDGSDNGSGTQSSWTKCLAQVGSPHPLSPHKQLVDPPDSTCAQVMQTKTEKASCRWVHATEKECLELIDHLDDVAMGKDLAVGISLSMQLEHRLEGLSSNPMGKGANKMSDDDDMQIVKGQSNACEKGEMECNGGKTRTQENQTMNVIDVTDSNSPQAESRDLNTPNGFSGFSLTKENSCPKEHPSLELTLKRLGEVRDPKNVTGEECNVLRHSDQSAFSKYNTASSANQARTGNVGSCSPLANGSAAPNAEVINNFPSHSNVTPPNQQSNGSNNINDMASINTYLGTKPCTFDKMPESVRGLGSFNSSELRTIRNNSISSSQKKTYAREEYMEIVRGQVGSSEHEFKAEHTHYELHHYNHISRKAAVDLQSDHDLLLKRSTNTAQQCVSSNAFGGPAESNAANYTIDGNAGESDHGSNGHGSNGQDGTMTMRTVNVENGNVAVGSIGVGGIDRKTIGNGADEGRLSLREAALTKFRQKRKERCFEKRVRYHSRKKLAEQRPRIRGQFVRRIVSEAKEEKDHQSDNLVPGDNTDIPQ
ncbi:two-component response regulator-like APRR3 isoform X2 [Vigna angularis]|uniref:two-component response regulator-like APRR3 isoform X2 n=1 Tax=Phaseolus angularis TaxID=3914 RepID=UPI0022B391EF|nr:two-component response regulator-like APRR3 isoform X2 [Vigna angularis]XP_052734515.1 two-component response regulator-like APRR3 isoform X2 [Vigna angularis]XP_052734516.1 two-component response regulator-like APRR3 isoform X2 [Vigna angularis]